MRGLSQVKDLNGLLYEFMTSQRRNGLIHIDVGGLQLDIIFATFNYHQHAP